MNQTLACVLRRLEAQSIQISAPDAEKHARPTEEDQTCRRTSLRKATLEATPNASQKMALQTVVASRN